MNYRKLIQSTLAFSVLLFSQKVSSQTESYYVPTPVGEKNFFEIIAAQKSSDASLSSQTLRKSGVKQFKRWEHFWRWRVDENGNFPRPDVWQIERAKADIFHKKNKSESPLEATANNPEWTIIGPVGSPKGNNGGIGRLNGVTLSQKDAKLIWVASAGGGAWKSTDGGKTWGSTTDKLASLAVNDIALDPKNENIVYLATGDDWATGAIYRNPKGVGVLKSIDGGNTWLETGLKWTLSQGQTVSKVLVHPENSAILLATTSDGIWRSTNSGDTWTKVASGHFRDLDFHREDFTIWYASTNTQFFRSTDGGVKWTSQSVSGMPSGCRRTAISSSEADPDKVFMVVANASNRFGGFFVSSDAGESWTRTSTTPSILEDNISGEVNAGRQGQGWYDLAITASPLSDKTVQVGGINIWRSTNNGTGWTIQTHWYGDQGKPYVHADIHDLDYSSVDGKLYAATDGGLYVSSNTGSTWQEINGNLAIMQFYRLSIHETNTLYLGGSQDNGTSLANNSTWKEAAGGDGMDNAIDPSNSQMMYCSGPNGDFKRSSNGGASFSSMLTDNTTGESADWVAPLTLDMKDPRIVYAGHQSVWKSTDKGVSWKKAGTIPTSGSSTVNCIAVAESNNSFVYVTNNNGFYVSTDAGSTWTQRTGMPVSASSISRIAVSNSSHMRICISVSRFGSANVYESLDGGQTWKDISSGLPRVPANCVSYQKSNDRIFVGTDVGIYYRDKVASSFSDYNQGLPNVVINDLEINASKGKLVAATFGRGVWEANLPSCEGGILGVTVKGDTTFCEGSSVTLEADNGYNGYVWSSGEQARSITITKSGEYFVSGLDDKGCPFGSRTIKIIVNEKPEMAITTQTGTTTPQANVFCGIDSVRLRASTGFNSLLWSNGVSTRNVTFKETGKYFVTGTTSEGCVTVSDTIDVFVMTKPVLGPQVQEVFTAPAASAYQWMVDGKEIQGATGNTFKGGPQYNNKKFSVRITNEKGCQATSNEVVFIADGTGVAESDDGTSVVIMPNPTTNSFTIVPECQSAPTIKTNLYNSLGVNVISKTFEYLASEKLSFDVTGLPAGAYLLRIEGCGVDKMIKVVIQ